MQVFENTAVMRTFEGEYGNIAYAVLTQVPNTPNYIACNLTTGIEHAYWK